MNSDIRIAAAVLAASCLGLPCAPVFSDRFSYPRYGHQPGKCRGGSTKAASLPRGHNEAKRERNKRRRQAQKRQRQLGK